MVEIKETFTPGAIGAITALHAHYYAEHWGFGTFFEAKVARELAEFAVRRAEDDLVLLAIDDEGVAASLIIDLHDPHSGSRGAHLRWFIVHERLRGSGVGRQLMGRAVVHIGQRSNGQSWLTTFSGLAAARHLYEVHGYKLVYEAHGEAWGTMVYEQEFQRGKRTGV